jgi:predicted NAD/FAD-binding protein
MKIRPVGAELFHADGGTDRYDDLIVTFLNFAKAPKNALNLLRTNTVISRQFMELQYNIQLCYIALLPS